MYILADTYFVSLYGGICYFYQLWKMLFFLESLTGAILPGNRMQAVQYILSLPERWLLINGENVRKQGEINREIGWLPIKYKQINVLKYKQEYISREWLTETNKTEQVAMKVPLCYLCAPAMWLIQEVKKKS